MKIKTLLTVLCSILCCISGYGQEHLATPRREIRHLIADEALQEEMNNPMQRATGGYILNSAKEFPTVGEDVKALVILAEFNDVKFSVSHDSIKTLLSKRYNEDNYTEEIKYKDYSKLEGQKLPFTIPGSARDYFRHQSHGKFVPQFDVVGPVTLDNSRKYYGRDSIKIVNNKEEIVKTDILAYEMILEACVKADELVNFAEYCNMPNAKKVDIVYVVYAGCDEAQTGEYDAIWAKSWSLSSSPYGSTLPLDGVNIDKFACSGELLANLDMIAGIGTFAHEFSHVLGLPDFYNTQNGNDTRLLMDTWSIMDYGLYNALGFAPCPYTAFERYSLGWIPMQTIKDGTTMEIGTTDIEGKGFRIFTSEKDTTSYYLVETIDNIGWNEYAYAEGLLISRVKHKADNWANGKVNTTGDYRYYIVPANDNWSLGIYPKDYAPGHLFGNTNREYSEDSTPASETGINLVDIVYDSKRGVTSFKFCKEKETIEEGDTNGMEVIKQEKDYDLYNLQGRKVKDPSSGIYIRNGKKVVIK